MARELKIGILALLVIAGIIISYQFMKGKNVFNNSKVFYSQFDNIDQLEVAAPVLINGIKIGTVTDIRLNPKDVKSVLVTYEVDGNIPFPKNTIAKLQSAGLMGGKVLNMSFDAICNGNNCAQSGDYLQGGAVGMVESMLGVNDMSNYASTFKTTVAETFDTLSVQLSDQGSDSPINQTLWDMQETMDNMAAMTQSMNALMNSSYTNLTSTIKNLSLISNSLVENSDQIKGMLANMEDVTGQLKEANLGNTISKSNEAIDQTTQLIKDLQVSLGKTDETFTEMNGILSKVSTGDGSLSKLLNDKELYTNMEETSRHLSLLLQDLRLNPKRYVGFSIFGRKGNKDYEAPDEDPGLDPSTKESKN